MQLWNKQKTSVFANSWRRSRVILIDEHFKPICNKIKPTTHSLRCWHLNMLKMIKQVRGDPYGWIKKRSTKLISEYQDCCHPQLLKKHNISEFKGLWKRSKIILIEKHFMPTCSRITSTTFSAKIRRRWSANWVMWSYLSCAKLYQKYNVLTVFLNQGIVYCTCGQCLVDSESRKSFNKRRLDALSIPNYVMKKGGTHGARHGKTEVQREYRMAWNAWNRCCKKVDSQGEHFTGIHYRFLRYPVNRESQLAIGWTEQKFKEMDELAKEDHTYHLTSEEQTRYLGQWYLTLNKSGRNGSMKLRSDFRAAVSVTKSSSPRFWRKSWRAYFSRTVQSMASLFKHIVVGQVWMELEMSP